MRDWIASAMKHYSRSDMDITTPRPMLNTPTENDAVGQAWLQEILSRLRESRIAATKIPMLFNMTDENGRVGREAIKLRYTRIQRNS
jgi:hypothetical protein